MNRTKQARNELTIIKHNAYTLQMIETVGDLKVSYGTLGGFFITINDKKVSESAAEEYLAKR